MLLLHMYTLAHSEYQDNLSCLALILTKEASDTVHTQYLIKPNVLGVQCNALRLLTLEKTGPTNIYFAASPRSTFVRASG